MTCSREKQSEQLFSFYFTWCTLNFTTHCLGKQEALLSQTDRATRRVSRILANCCITVYERLVRQDQNKSK